MSEDREDGGGFKVTDRRRFRPEEDPETADATPVQPEDETFAGRRGEGVTFAGFVMGLSTQVLLHLGEVADPATGKTERDLPAAQQLIDILGVLRAKTAGNLDENESALLDSMLYDLRIRYVALATRPAGEPRKEPS